MAIRTSLCAVALFIFYCRPASAVIFTIDSAQSFLTLGGQVQSDGTPVLPQFDDSDTTALGGTLAVDLSTPGKIGFQEGGVVSTHPQPPGAFPTSPPAHLAVQIAPLLIFPVVYSVFSEIDFEITGPAAPIAGDGSFVNSAVEIAFLSGPYIGGIGDGLGNKLVLPNSLGDLHPLAASNLAFEGSLAAENGEYVLTLPLSLLLFNFVEIEGQSDRIDYEFEGQIVATAPVPEPSALVLIGLGLVGFSVFCYASRATGLHRTRPTRR